MRFLVLTAVALLPGMSAAAPLERQPVRPNGLEALGPWRSDCPPTAAQQVAQQIQKQGHRPQSHRLIDLPAASAYAAMVRQVGGCELPLIIRHNAEPPRR